MGGQLPPGIKGPLSADLSSADTSFVLLCELQEQETRLSLAGRTRCNIFMCLCLAVKVISEV